MVKTKAKLPSKSVLVLSTGGTLGMSTKSEMGSLVPADILNNLLTWIPELEDYASISVEIVANMDSSLVSPDLWLTLARRIETCQYQKDYDGVVILHGTDTLGYTSSALSFLLPHLELPVVLTGSQKPLAVTRTDARNNILGAVETALEGPTEVMVFFDNKAFRGNRVTKTAISEFNAFSSPNFPALGRAGIDWQWASDLFWPQSRRPTMSPELPSALPNAPLVLPWVPGLDLSWLKPALAQQWALLLEAFGTGNMPFSDDLCHTLTSFADRGGLILVKSQVPKGGVSLGTYAAGAELVKLGAIPCGDMTREAVITKLMVLKGYGRSNQRIAALQQTALVGELSEG